MDETAKRKMIRKYLTAKFPKWALVLIGVGLLMMLTGSSGPILLGLLLIAGGGFAIYSSSQGLATDEQMDSWLSEDMVKLNQTALNKTGVDTADLVGETVVVTGPKLWDVGNAEVMFRKGKDNHLRFTPIGVNVINFTKDQLVSYACAFDFLNGRPLSESTDEYFYKDVVSVATKTESMNVNIVKLGSFQLTAAEKFTLTTSGGTSISVVLRDPTLIAKMGGGEIPTTSAEKAIQTVRKMLREKKAS